MVECTYNMKYLFLFWGGTCQSTICLSCRDGAHSSWVYQDFWGVNVSCSMTRQGGRGIQKGTTRRTWHSNPPSLDPEYDILPLSHYAPPNKKVIKHLWCLREKCVDQIIWFLMRIHVYGIYFFNRKWCHCVINIISIHHCTHSCKWYVLLFMIIWKCNTRIKDCWTSLNRWRSHG